VDTIRGGLSTDVDTIRGGLSTDVDTIRGGLSTDIDTYDNSFYENLKNIMSDETDKNITYKTY
jgi:hypothetical protein